MDMAGRSFLLLLVFVSGLFGRVGHGLTPWKQSGPDRVVAIRAGQ
jgi:hypothetical protein